MSAECPVCGNRESAFKVVQRGVRDPAPDYAPKALSCNSCGSVFLWPQLDLDAQQRFYADNVQLERTLGRDFDWDDYISRTRPDTERRLRLLESLVGSDDRVLEVGCGYGFLLSLITDRVREAIGIEPGHARRAFGRNELGLDIRFPPLATSGVARGSVDIVCAFQVLEHIARPRTFLAEMFDVLKANGLLVIEVPNYADAYVSLLPSYRAYHFQTAHPVYYTPGSLRRVLQCAGFSVAAMEGVQRYAIANALHWALRGEPQHRRPSRNTNGGIVALVDRAYRSFLTRTLRSDTLICLARKQPE